MKYLILLFVMACGQHKEPSFQDLRDFDGDQILNYQESGNEKVFANIESIGEVKGVLKILTNQVQEISFSNSVDKKKVITQMMVMNEAYLKETPCFSEWTHLHLKSELQLTLKAKQYSVHLSFSSTTDLMDEVAVISDKGTEVLAPWSPYIKLELSSDLIQDLLSGKKNLAVKKKLKKSPLFQKESDETIKEKTARLYFFDGKSASISYFSNQMQLKDILVELNITKSTSVDERELIFNFASDEIRWFHRELKNGDKILIKSSERELKEELLKRFEITKTTVTRENGMQAKIKSLANRKGANIYLRISEFTRIDRKFNEKIVTKLHGRYGSARQGDWFPGINCHHYMREIVEETSTSPDKEELFDYFSISTLIGGKSILPQEALEEKFGEDGVFWEANFIAEEDNLIAGLDSLPLHSFTVTGEFNNSCPGDKLFDGRFASISTNPEGKLSFILESYVEKIP